MVELGQDANSRVTALFPVSCPPVRLRGSKTAPVLLQKVRRCVCPTPESHCWKAESMTLPLRENKTSTKGDLGGRVDGERGGGGELEVVWLELLFQCSA